MTLSDEIKIADDNIKANQAQYWWNENCWWYD